MTHYHTMLGGILILASVGAVAITQETKGAEPPGMQSRSIGSADEKQVAQIQENIKRMQQQMEQIRNPRDLKARDRLLREHMRAMQENMHMMRGMGGSLMNTMTGSSGFAGAATSATDPSQRDQLERRMDIMHMMMEQMMQHHEMMQSAPRIRKLTGTAP